MSLKFKSSSESSFEQVDSEEEFDFFANKQVQKVLAQSQAAKNKELEELWEHYDEKMFEEEPKQQNDDGFQISASQKERQRVKANLKVDPQDGNLLPLKEQNEEEKPKEELYNPYWQDEQYVDGRGLGNFQKQARFRPKSKRYF